MGWFQNLLERMRPQGNRALPPQRAAGMFVDEDRALSHSSVYASVRLISESIAALPWRLHRRLNPRGNEIVNNDLDYLIHVEASAENSAFVWRETILANALLWGNGYAEIERTASGEPWNLWLVSPDSLHPDRTQDGRLWYVNKGAPVLAAENVFHLRGLGFDGLQGYSVVRHAARSIGLGLALDQMAADTYANGAQPSVIITQASVGKPLSAEGVTNMIKSWEARFKGPGNGSRVGFLDAGLEAKQFGMPLTDQQFLESRRFQVSEIARWFRVPPHKLADLERATFSNIEHQGLEFVSDTLMPWIRRLETEAQIKLIGRNNRSGKLYTKINVAALLRGDLPSRYTAYATGRQWGWLSANDVRELEDQNPVAGGDEYLAPMNMVPADMLRDLAEPKPVQVDQPIQQEPIANKLMQIMMENKHEPNQQPINVNVSPSPINVAAPVLNIAPSSVTVQMPDIKVEPLVDISSPVINIAPTEIHPTIQVESPVVNVMPADVRIENKIIEREQHPPIVNISPAEINIEAIMPSQQDINILSLPDRQTVTDVIRDSTGKIVESSQIETDIKVKK